MFSKNMYIIIGVVIILGLVVLYYMYSKNPIHNEGFVSDETDASDINDVNDLMEKLTDEENKEYPVNPNEEDVDQATLNKLNWKNQFIGNKSNYRDGIRGNTGVDEWNDYYNTNANTVDNSYLQNNDKFVPTDETSGNMAPYRGKGHTTNSPEDLFKNDKLLPQEVNKDWFEVMPEPIKVKNRHLINITRPMGVNTIGSALKNASHDLRGDEACPKFVVAPWLQSSIEPDLNIKGLC